MSVPAFFLQDLIRAALNESEPEPAAIPAPKGKGALIVDLGAWQTRAGFARCPSPQMVFDSTIHRWKDDSHPKNMQEWQVRCGRSTPGGKNIRATSRPLFDGPLLLHTPSAENVLDHVFSGLLDKREAVDLIITEPILNPPHCHQELRELLSDGYNSIKRFAFVLDAPLSAWFTLKQHHAEQLDPKAFTAFIIDIGCNATHVIPIINGSILWPHVRRINWGTNTGIECLQKSLALKYPSILTTSVTATAPSLSSLQQAPVSPFPLTFFAASLLWQAVAQVVPASGGRGYDHLLESLVSSEESLSRGSIALRYMGTAEEELHRQQTAAASAKLLAEQQALLAAKRAELADKLRKKAAEQKEAKLRSKQHIVTTLKTLIDRVQNAVSGKGSNKAKASAKRKADDDDILIEGEEIVDDIDLVEDEESGADGFDDGELQETGHKFSLEMLKGDDKLLVELHRFGYKNLNDLQDGLRVAELELAQLTGDEPAAAAGTAMDYTLLNVPDEELNEAQVKEKRRLKLIKASADARERQKAEKEASEAKRRAESDALEQLRLHDLAAWRRQLYGKRRELLDGLEARQKSLKAVSERRSNTGTSRLRTAAVMAGADSGDANENVHGPSSVDDDGFGMNDDDWLVYRHLSGDDQDEMAQEQQEALSRIETLLEEQDRDEFFRVLGEEARAALSIIDRLKYPTESTDDSGASSAAFSAGPTVYINVERWKCTEGLFQPAAIHGIDSAGLGEVMQSCITDLLSKHPRDVFSRLSKSVVVTGTVAGRLPGLVDRVRAELRSALPEDCELSVVAAADGLSAWRGAADLVNGQAFDEALWSTSGKPSHAFYLNP